MTTDTSIATAGLIFQGLRDLDIVNIGNRVRNAFEALEQNVTGMRVLSNDQVCISSNHHNVTVKVLEDHVVDGLPNPAPLLLEVSIDGASLMGGDVPHKDTVLAHALKSLHWTLSADQGKGVTPGAVLSSADFVMATTQPEPQNTPAKPKVIIDTAQPGIIERRYTLPSIDETNELLLDRLSQKAILSIETKKQGTFCSAFMASPGAIGVTDDEDIREKTAPLRLSVWMVSFTVALFALPVGAALLVFNVLKGENLRLSAQTAALTGTFIALDANGATADTLALFSGLVG